MRRIVKSLVVVMLAVSSVAAVAAELDATQTKQIEKVVQNYLLQNPEVVVQSLQGYQQKQMEQAQKTIQKTQSSSLAYADALFHQANDPMAGNAKAAVTIVEFFDYQCPHCIDMTPIIDDLVKNNNNVKVVFKEFPIRGPASDLAARAALAANQQGKYFELHKALMNSKQQPLTEEMIYTIAKTVGLNVDQLKTAMNSDAVNQQLKATYKLAQDLRLLGTPAFFVGKSNVTKTSPATAVVFLPGQVDAGQIKQVIDRVLR